MPDLPKALHFYRNGQWECVDLVPSPLYMASDFMTASYVWRTSQAVAIAPKQADYIVSNDYSWYLNKAWEEAMKG